jgi:glycosyltransferase involved in cell wall biosynthesis
MRILLTVISYRYLTGAELYIYELAREYRKLGHDVTIASFNTDPQAEIVRRTEVFGARVLPMEALNPSMNFDVMHLNEYHPARVALEIFPDTPAITSIHSQWECETPFVDERIHRYIFIRPGIEKHWEVTAGIPAEKFVLIYNPIDFERFTPLAFPPNPRRVIVFPGTVDTLRKASILFLAERARSENFILRVVGAKTLNETYLDILPPNVELFPMNWNIARFIQSADETAGIVLGRTTIEGWACGKPGWIFDIHMDGSIRSFGLHPPPLDMSPFDSRLVAQRILDLYEEALNIRRA